MNVYDQIAQNKLKTYLFIAGFVAFVAFVAYILGGATDSGPGFAIVALLISSVIAHELGHVKNYDIRLMAVVTVLAGVVVLMVDMFSRSLWFGTRLRDDDRNSSGAIFLVIGLVISLLAPLIATVMKLAISRKREYLADATGAYLTRNPGALADALIKISADPQRMRNASNATAHLFFANPFKKQSNGSWIASLFNTHPPVEDRVKLLRTM